MNRFYFHIKSDGKTIHDLEGILLADIEAAKKRD